MNRTWASLKSSWPISTLDGPWRASTTRTLFCMWAADFRQSPGRTVSFQKELPSIQGFQGEGSRKEGRAKQTRQGPQLNTRQGRKTTAYLRQHVPAPAHLQSAPPRCALRTRSSRQPPGTPTTAGQLALLSQRKGTSQQTDPDTRARVAILYWLGQYGNAPFPSVNNPAFQESCCLLCFLSQ